MQFLHRRIKHVIYVVKENRTFDQILGDLTNGAERRSATDAVRRGAHAEQPSPGDRVRDARQLHESGRRQHGRLVLGDAGPCHQHRSDHAADQLRRRQPRSVLRVRRDESQRAGELQDGCRARRRGRCGRDDQLQHASAGLPGGTANLLPGTGNHASTDAPFGIQDGYIFNAVLKAGGTVRNYGFLVNNIGSIGTRAAPVVRSVRGRRSCRSRPSIRTGAADRRLLPRLRPELSRTSGATKNGSGSSTSSSPIGNLPSLSLVRISHDHMGNFGRRSAA